MPAEAPAISCCVSSVPALPPVSWDTTRLALVTANAPPIIKSRLTIPFLRELSKNRIWFIWGIIRKNRFPVRIDPTIEVGLGINSANPNESYIFDLEVLANPYIYVTNAIFTADISGADEGDGLAVYAYRYYNGLWSGGYYTFDANTVYDIEYAGDHISQPVIGYTFDVTRLVAENTIGNLNLLSDLYNRGFTVKNTGLGMVALDNCVLTVEYEVIAGITDLTVNDENNVNYTYTTLELDRIGTAYINNLNRDFNLLHTVIPCGDIRSV